jgi:hypothetical protein
MSQLPLYHPESEGKGRLSVFRLFKQGSISEKQVVESFAGGSRQVLRGVDSTGDGDYSLVVVDLEPGTSVPAVPGKTVHF